MTGNKKLKAFALAGLFAAATAVGQPAAIAAPLVDQTIVGPIGGAEICVAGRCRTVEGIKNLHVSVDVTPGLLTAPVVTTGSAPGCTANINLAVFATAPALSGGSITPLVEFDRTDKNGAVIPGSHTVIGGTPVAVPPLSPMLPNPLLSVCAALLN